MEASCQLTPPPSLYSKPVPTPYLGPSSTVRVSSPRKRRRRGKLTFLLVATSLVVVVVVVGSKLLEKHIRESVLPALSERFSRKIEVGEIRFGLGSATMSDLRVSGEQDVSSAPLLRVKRAKVVLDWRELLHGEVQVKSVALSGVKAQVVRGTQGQDNVTDLLHTLMGAGRPETLADSVSGADSESGSSSESGTSSRLKSARVSITDLRLTIRDEATDADLVFLAESANLEKKRGVALFGVRISGRLSLHEERMSLDVEASELRLSPDGRIQLKVQELQADSSDARVHELLATSPTAALYVERVRGQGGEWQVNLLGRFEAARGADGDEQGEEESFVASATLFPGGIRLHLAADHLRLARIAPLLRSVPNVDVEGAVVSGQWDVRATREEFSVQGEMQLSGVALDHPRLARQRVQMRPTNFAGRASFHRRRGEFRVHDATITSSGVPYQVSLEVLLPGFERVDHPSKKLSARVSMPMVPCQNMVASLPTGLAPHLQDFVLIGVAEGEVSLMIDWQDLESTQLDLNMNLDDCAVTAAPEHMSKARLANSFEHRVPVPGGHRKFVIGPENPDFVALEKVSRNLKRSFLTTEDSAFYRHEGFITKEFRGALVKNLKRGRFAYGASSISMQVVKNVLLTREKTVSRKLQELFLTWHLERVLSKDRILEIYVNAIEFGPGLYGIKPAAKQYFAKHPRALNPVESAFLSSLLPAPTKRYKQYCGGRLRPSTSRKIERILGFMHKRHRLDEEQYALALETPLSFRGRRKSLCRQAKPQPKGQNS